MINIIIFYITSYYIWISYAWVRNNLLVGSFTLCMCVCDSPHTIGIHELYAYILIITIHIHGIVGEGHLFANCSPWAKSGLMPILVNKVWLKHSHSNFSYALSVVCLPYKGRVEYLWPIPYDPQNLTCFLSSIFRKSLSTLDLENYLYVELLNICLMNEQLILYVNEWI